MYISVWYHVDELLPSASGWYVVKKEIVATDLHNGVRRCYWDNEAKMWKVDHTINAAIVKASWWTEIDFDFNRWNKYTDLTPAESAAFDNIKYAIEQYNIIRVLSRPCNQE